MTGSGLSKTGLDRLHELMTGHVEHGGVPGLVTVVSRRGEVHVDAVGTKAVGGAGGPVQRDTIFRIASMTKPVTAVAAMILVEEGRLRLDEPVDSLAARARRSPGAARARQSARRHRSRDAPDHGARRAHVPHGPRDADGRAGHLPGAARVCCTANSATDHPCRRNRRHRTSGCAGSAPCRSCTNRGSSGPITSAPTCWACWSRARRASRSPTFLRERIFDPLGMRDTAFSVPPEKIDRFATSYATDPETGALVVFDEAAGGQWSSEPAFPSGGGGLVSTADDFVAFGQMMLNHGKLGNERILSRRSVETMTTDQLTPEVKRASAGNFPPGFFDTNGWGFGLRVVTGRANVYDSVGKYGWDGGLGTCFSVGPVGGTRHDPIDAARVDVARPAASGRRLHDRRVRGHRRLSVIRRRGSRGAGTRRAARSGRRRRTGGATRAPCRRRSRRRGCLRSR